MIYLADVNFWLALAFESHTHHAAAVEWFDGMSPADRCAYSRMTQQGFLRLATNPKAFDEEAVTLSQAWQMYDAFLADARVVFVQEPASIEPLWREFTIRNAFTPKVWNDAYLAAFARDAGYELVSFDRGFSRFSGLAHRILS